MIRLLGAIKLSVANVQIICQQRQRVLEIRQKSTADERCCSLGRDENFTLQTLSFCTNKGAGHNTTIITNGNAGEGAQRGCNASKRINIKVYRDNG